MKICIPVESDQGIDSQVSAHFGSAPIFMIVDSDTLNCKAIINTNEHHSHGMCQPLAVLKSEKFDGIVVGGIGMGAFNKLQAAKIKVFRTKLSTIKEAIDAHKSGTLKEVTEKTACASHGSGHSEGHNHRHRQSK